MKFQFSKEEVFRPEWNNNLTLPEGEQVSMTIKVLAMQDILDLMDTLESQASNGQADSVNLDNATTGKLVNKATALLPTYVSEFVGLEGPDGPIGVGDICEYPQFIGLIIEILFQMISISTPNEDDVKN